MLSRAIDKLSVQRLYTSMNFRTRDLLIAGLLALLFGSASMANAANAPINVINVNDGGAGSLRDAITKANNTSGMDSIQFKIAGTGLHTINLLSPLPAITDRVVIDGTSQAGYSSSLPNIELDGAAAGGNTTGLIINAGFSTVKGLIINRFSNHGIQVVSGGGNVIDSNRIGTNAAGDTALGNSWIGVLIDSSGNNVISNNVISGNGQTGVYVTRPGATNNTVRGNKIGTNMAGTAALQNTDQGVLIDNVPGNLISNNLISGNGANGIYIAGSGASGNTLQGNEIGTNAAGNAALGNGAVGVLISGAPSTLIGGTIFGQGNVISGNGSEGIEIDGTTATNNAVQANRIGTDAQGVYRLGNNFNGIYINNAANNMVGSSDFAARNIISGNGASGIAIVGSGATANSVLYNVIGLDFYDQTSLANAGSAIVIAGGASYNIIGAAGAGNTLGGGDTSQSTQMGVQIELGATNNTVQANYIGSNSAGFPGLSFSYGVFISCASDNIIGNVGAGNIISENVTGIFIDNFNCPAGYPSTNNVVQANYIGTNYNGTIALPNSVGVLINWTTNTVIGNVGAGNVISGNRTGGVVLAFSGGTEIRSNYIGTNVNGAVNIGNGGPGISISDDSSTNVIGGNVAGTGNVIAYNTKGVALVHEYKFDTGDIITNNSIYNNTVIDIDLQDDGPTPNDLSDLDAGPNNLQNYPTVTSITGVTTLHVAGNLNSLPNTSYAIQLFASKSCSASGYGGGQTYLKTTGGLTNSSGNMSFTVDVTPPPGQDFITATVINISNNDTSEFSNCVKTSTQLATATPIQP